MEEVEMTLYNKKDIESLPLKEINEVVMTTQNSNFLAMALEDYVFFPYSNFSPSLLVAYYFTNNCPPTYARKITHIARIRSIWHDITIKEVLSTIPDFEKYVPDFLRFKKRLQKIRSERDPSERFPIAITERPIQLRNPIIYQHAPGNQLLPRIIPGRHTTLEKILTATTLEELR